MARRHLRPATGARVRKADGTILPAGGERLTMTPYLARLLAEGDIVAGEPRKTPKRTIQP